jgi:hypothetical protein
MNIQESIIVTLAACALAATGCQTREPEVRVPNDPVPPRTPVLTATAPEPSLPAPVADGHEPLAETLEPKPTEPATAGVGLAEPAPAELGRAEPELAPGADGLRLHRFVTTSAVEAREPSAAASSFESGTERVYAFIEAENESAEARTLRVHFIGPRGTVSGGVELEIPGSSPRWRTWAYTRFATEPGLWRAEIRDENGLLVGALPFEITPVF